MFGLKRLKPHFQTKINNQETAKSSSVHQPEAMLKLQFSLLVPIIILTTIHTFLIPTNIFQNFKNFLFFHHTTSNQFSNQLKYSYLLFLAICHIHIMKYNIT